MTDKTPLPRNWKNFLRVDTNKSELFKMLAKSFVNLTVPGKTIVSTTMEKVLTNCSDDIINELGPCNHEEGGTRLFLHAKHCSQEGHAKILIKTVDTDVVIIAISKFTSLELDELWIELGAGKTRRWIPVHRIGLHSEKTNVLLCYIGMRLPVATRYHRLLAKEKQLDGNAGKHTLIARRLLRDSQIAQKT